MSFRRKLLAVFTLTVFFAVVVVSVVVAAITRRTFERADEERTAALLAQFRREFQRRGTEVARRVENIAASEPIQRMAMSLSRQGPDYASYLSEAQSVAQSQQLEFLEFVDSQGSGRQSLATKRRKSANRSLRRVFSRKKNCRKVRRSVCSQSGRCRSRTSHSWYWAGSGWIANSFRRWSFQPACGWSSTRTLSLFFLRNC